MATPLATQTMSLCQLTAMDSNGDLYPVPHRISKRERFKSLFRKRRRPREISTSAAVVEQAVEKVSDEVVSLGVTVTSLEESSLIDGVPEQTALVNSNPYIQPSTALSHTSFKKLFSKSKSKNYLDHFENMDPRQEDEIRQTLKKSRTIRERFFSFRSRREKIETGIPDPEVSVFEAEQTLTQRYTDYDLLAHDMDAIEFDLTLREPTSMRYKVSKVIQLWSPSKHPTNLQEYFDTVCSDVADKEWNPYQVAKSVLSLLITVESKVEAEDKEITRFGTFKRSLSTIFRSKPKTELKPFASSASLNTNGSYQHSLENFFVNTGSDEWYEPQTSTTYLGEENSLLKRKASKRFNNMTLSSDGEDDNEHKDKKDDPFTLTGSTKVPPQTSAAESNFELQSGTLRHSRSTYELSSAACHGDQRNPFVRPHTSSLPNITSPHDDTLSRDGTPTVAELHRMISTNRAVHRQTMRTCEWSLLFG